jgi:hypothetical protein
MGWIALIIVGTSVAFWFFSLLFFLYNAFGIYKTARYGYRDLQPWMERFRTFSGNAQDVFNRLGERGSKLADISREVSRNFEGIADEIDEIRSHPYVKVAKFFSRFR